MCSVPRNVGHSLALVIFLISATGLAFPQESQKKASGGTISGHVKVDDGPAQAITVMLLPAEDGPVEKAISKATTDKDGYFQMKGVPAGSYRLQAFAPTMIATGLATGRSQTVNLLDGESIDGLELSLKAGGVITGRITDADGQPIVQENVRLVSVNERSGKQFIYIQNSYMFPTDDRGVYRLFGVPVGRYLVCIGGESSGVNSRFGGSVAYYHPDTSDDSKAAIIEVTPGSETSGVDIMIGSSKRYNVSGRIIDATTGRPISNITYGYGVQDARSNGFRMTSFSGSTTNTRGEFRLESVSPGHYAAFAQPMAESDLYSDLAVFDVTDSDVAGLIVKVHAGSRISGNAIIEGGDRQPVPRLSDIQIGYTSWSLNVAPRNGMVRISPDGSFRVTGLSRGVARFYLQTYSSPKGLSLARIERDGLEQKEGIEVGSDEEITGVKLIISYGTGVIRAQVKVDGGEITPTTMMFLNLRRTDGKPLMNDNSRQMQMPDLRGRFVISGLTPGEYELMLVFQSRQASPDGPPSVSKEIKQTVSVTNGTESEVTMIVDLNKEH